MFSAIVRPVIVTVGAYGLPDKAEVTIEKPEEPAKESQTDGNKTGEKE